jgi:hypothetical protein
VKDPVIECVPEIIVEKVMIPIPAELVQIWENPAVPSAGDHLDLLNWAQACAVTTYLYKNQMKQLRSLK